MSGETILVVDDEVDLVDLIKFNLDRSRYRVLTAHDGDAALQVARRDRPELIILDLMLPALSGQDVAVALKRHPETQAIPIIMLTARTEESDIVVGLQLGADDYVTKPFSMKVLLARVAAVLRRRQEAADSSADLLRAGPITIDRGRHVVRVDGKVVSMTRTEFKLLDVLVSARSYVMSRDQLVDRALGPGVAVTDRTIDVHVTSLRRKLGSQRELVETVRGVGYRFADVWAGGEGDD